VEKLCIDKKLINVKRNDLLEGKIHVLSNDMQFGNRNTGKEVELCYWDGLPFKKGSKLRTLCKKMVNGTQEIEMKRVNGTLPWYEIQGKVIDNELLAKNEGMALFELRDWERKVTTKNENYLVIHFTDFRY